MKHSLALRFALVALAALTPGCIVVVDGQGGFETHAAWNDDWDGSVVKGSGIAAVQPREVPDFREVQVRGSADVRLQAGVAKSVAVHCDDNLLERVITRVENGVLVIELEPGSYRFKCELVVDVATPALDGLRISGSGDATVTGLNGGALRLEVSGSGDIMAQGSVDELRVSLSGSGDLSLYGLATRRATLAIAGSGDVALSVSEALDATISGSGDVRYRGSPRVTSSVSGSGSVERD